MLSTAVLLYHRYTVGIRNTVVRLSRTVCLSQAERCVRVADWQLRLMVSLVHSFSLSRLSPPDGHVLRHPRTPIPPNDAAAGGRGAGATCTWGERRAGDVDVNEVFTRPLGLSQGLCIWLCICSVSAKKADTLYPAVHVLAPISVDPNHCM